MAIILMTRWGLMMTGILSTMTQNLMSMMTQPLKSRYMETEPISASSRLAHETAMALDDLAIENPK